MSSLTFDRSSLSNDELLVEDRTRIVLGACLPLHELGVRCVRCNLLYPLLHRCRNCDGNGYADISTGQQGGMGVFCNKCDLGWTDWTCRCGTSNRTGKTLVYIKKYVDLKPQSLDEFLKLALYHEKKRHWFAALQVVSAGLQQFPSDSQLAAAANHIRQAEADEKAAHEREAARVRREQEEATERKRREQEEAAERKRRELEETAERKRRAEAEAEQRRLEAVRRARAERRQRNLRRTLVVVLLLLPAALLALMFWAETNGLLGYLDSALVNSLQSSVFYVFWTAIVCLWLLGATVTAWVYGGWQRDAGDILMKVSMWPLLLFFDLPCALQIIGIVLILFALLVRLFQG